MERCFETNSNHKEVTLFKVVVALDPIGEYPSFAEAFKVFYVKMKELVRGGVSRNVFETTCWIECPTPRFGEGSAMPLYINEIAPLAFEMGYLTDDEQLVQPFPVVEPESLTERITDLGLTRMGGEVLEIAKIFVAATT